MKPPRERARVVHPHAWLWEPLESEPGFILRPMFGGKSAYLDGRMVLFFAAKKEPWRGLLLPTDRAHHASLRAEFPALVVHPVLSKWLYLPETADAFERIGAELVRLVRHRDPRLGVQSQARRRPSGRKKSTRRRSRP